VRQRHGGPRGRIRGEGAGAGAPAPPTRAAGHEHGVGAARDASRWRVNTTQAVPVSCPLARNLGSTSGHIFCGLGSYGASRFLFCWAGRTWAY
jgi:hypothetical protein